MAIRQLTKKILIDIQSQNVKNTVESVWIAILSNNLQFKTSIKKELMKKNHFVLKKIQQTIIV